MMATEQVGKSDCAKTNMNINYSILQAREQLNEAVSKLLAKKDASSMLVERLNDTEAEARAAAGEQPTAHDGSVNASERRVQLGSIRLLGSDKDG